MKNKRKRDFILLIIIILIITLICFYPPKRIDLGDGFNANVPGDTMTRSTCKGIFIKTSGQKQNRQASSKGWCFGKIIVENTVWF